MPPVAQVQALTEWVVAEHEHLVLVVVAAVQEVRSDPMLSAPPALTERVIEVAQTMVVQDTVVAAVVVVEAYRYRVGAGQRSYHGHNAHNIAPGLHWKLHNRDNA